ncbi:MAG: hypothetical protein KGQ41_05460, partial [Alphaproteobacteria bacterium]|nr:hypothetical protein [Alphaproteobacteria bacterium]
MTREPRGLHNLFDDEPEKRPRISRKWAICACLIGGIAVAEVAAISYFLPHSKGDVIEALSPYAQENALFSANLANTIKYARTIMLEQTAFF